MKKIQSAASLLRQSAKELRERRANVSGEVERLSQRNRELLLLPLARSDAKQFVLDVVDRLAGEFIDLQDWGANFRVIARPSGGGRSGAPPGTPLNLMDVDQVLGGDSMDFGRVFGNDFGGNFMHGGRPLGQEAPSRVCFFFGDQVKKQIGQHFDSLFPAIGDSSSEGMPLTDRRSELAANTRRMDELQQELVEINEQLRDLTV